MDQHRPYFFVCFNWLRTWVRKRAFHLRDSKGRSSRVSFLLPCPSDPRRMGFSLPSSPVTPAECPTVELKPDTIYLEMGLDPTGQGLSPTRPTPFQMPIACPGCRLLPTVYKQIPVTLSSSSVSLLEQLTGLRKSCLAGLLVY